MTCSPSQNKGDAKLNNGITRINITDQVNGRGAYRFAESRVLQPAANTIYRAAFNGQGLQLVGGEADQDCALDEFTAGYDSKLGIDVLLNFTSGMQATLQEKFLTTGTTFTTVTIEYYQNWRTEEPGDWFKLRADYYFVGYYTKGAQQFDKWILLDWPAVKRATSRDLITWQENKNMRDGARASFRYANFWDIPEECVIGGEWPERQLRDQARDTLTTIAGQKPRQVDWDERKRRAQAFVNDGLRPGRRWADKPYDYQD